MDGLPGPERTHLGFHRDERGFTGAEKALIIAFALAIISLIGYLLNAGSQQSGQDASRTLAAGRGSLGSGTRLGVFMEPGALPRASDPGTPQHTAESPSPLAQANPGTFAQVIDQAPKEAQAPKQIVLPRELVQGMQIAWNQSNHGKDPHEQGGLLVRTKDGSYAWRPAETGEQGSINIEYEGLRPGEDPLVTGHTHPSPDAKEVDISFSGADISMLVIRRERFITVQSGDTVFALVRTAEFEQQLKGLDAAGRAALKREIELAWNEGYQNLPGNTKDVRSDEAARYIAKMYHLAYYRGTGGKLNLVDLGKDQ